MTSNHKVPLSIFKAHNVIAAIILSIGLSLRLLGLSWSIPTASIPHLPFQPDEVWAMSALSEINPLAGDFNPEPAHREGTLCYYIWTFLGLFAKKLGLLAKMPYELTSFDQDYGAFLFFARLVTALADFFSVVLVFFIIRRMTSDRLAPLLGAFICAITPFELIYAHYMRTHTFGNFFLLVVMYFSTLIYKRRHNGAFILASMCCGFAAGSRYPMGLAVVFPFWAIVHGAICSRWDQVTRSGRSFIRALIKPFLILGFFALLGFFIADPFIFLDFASARPHLETQGSYAATAEFSLLQLLNLSKLWDYFVYLIPYGSLPGLWIVFYVSCLFLLVQKKYYQYTVPIFVFLALYIYAMGKGYLGIPMFIRAMFPCFPLFAILSALAVAEIFSKLVRYRRLVVFLGICLASIFMTTLAYDFAYVSAMQKEDPRIQLYRYFSQAQDTQLGVYPHGLNYFLVNPTLSLLPHVQVQERDFSAFADTNAPMDYILLSAFEPNDFPKAKKRLQELQDSGGYSLETIFRTPLVIFGYEFNFQRNPQDLQYPFPTLYLLRRISPSPENQRHVY